MMLGDAREISRRAGESARLRDDVGQWGGQGGVWEFVQRRSLLHQGGLRRYRYPLATPLQKNVGPCVVVGYLLTVF